MCRRGRGRGFATGGLARTPLHAHGPRDLGEVGTAQLRSPKHPRAADGLMGDQAGFEASSRCPPATLRL